MNNKTNIYTNEYSNSYMPGYGDIIHYNQISPIDQMPTDNQPYTIEQIPTNNQPSSTEQMPINNQPSSTEQIPINNQPSSTEQMPINNQPSSTEQMPINNQPSSTSQLPSNNADETYILFLYPKEARQIKDIVNNKLNTLDYDGSIIFHQYPDKTALQDILNQIKVPYEIEAISPNWLQQLIQVIFYNEMYIRRNRHFNTNSNNTNQNSSTNNI